LNRERERERERDRGNSCKQIYFCSELHALQFEQLFAAVRDIDIKERAGNADGLQEKLNAF